MINIKRGVISTNISMAMTFAVFVFSLIAPMYLFISRENSFVPIAYGSIPGIELSFSVFNRIIIICFFSLIILFFLSHTFYEKKVSKKIFSAASCLYSAAYLTILINMGTSRLVFLGFPIISIPIWIIVASKFMILLPAVYFFIIVFEKGNNVFVRRSALFHGIMLVAVGLIKLFEIFLPHNMKAPAFDISITLYLVSLSMVMFFMYRKYYQ